MFVGNLGDAPLSPGQKLLVFCWLGVLMMLAAACEPRPPIPPAEYRTPSRVMTRDGVEYSVWGLRLPGTSQDLKLRSGEAFMWVPLNLVTFVRFSGPIKDRFRQADVYLLTGDRLRGELSVHQIIEGTTDAGYWNLPLENVDRLNMGLE